MYKIIEAYIPSCDDVECQIKRKNKLELKLSFDDKKSMKALFCLIAGLGEDNNESYQEKIAQFLVKDYELAVLRVNYFAIKCRPQLGATFYMNEKDKEIYLSMCAKLNISLAENFFPQGELNQQQSYAACAVLNNMLEQLKASKELEADFKLPLSISVAPAGDDYLNFGIMQAMDIINAILWVKTTRPCEFEQDYKIITFGSSHGGYLALKCAQFAPWLIDEVLENSAYVEIFYRFFALGKNINFITQSEFSAEQFFKNICLYATTKTQFSNDSKAQNYFSLDHQNIRHILHQKHLKIWAAYPKKAYISSYHAINDDLAPAQDKEKFFEFLKNLAYDFKFTLIKDEAEVDGKFIKHLKHGMDMSLKTLIKKELPQILQRKKMQMGGGLLKKIIYTGDKIDYEFEEKDNTINLKLIKH